MGREAAISPPSAVASCCAISMFVLLLDAPADSDDDFGLCQVHRLLRFFERSFGFVAYYPVRHLDTDSFDRRRGIASFDFVSAECSVLEGGKIWRLSGERYVGREFALKHLPGKRQLAALIFVTDRVANERPVERGRQLGSEVTHLIGMRHQYQPGLFLLQERLECSHEAVGRVGLQLWGL